MRRAARTDANHKEIINAFRAIGFSIFDTSKLGQGFGDCVIARSDLTAIVEIKDGAKAASQRRLTKPEQGFKDAWRGKYFIVACVDDVFNISREWGIK